MNDVQGVHVGESLQKLVHEEADELGLESVGGFLQNFEEVVLDVLEYEVDDPFLAEGLLELHDVGMLQHFEYFDLSHRGLFNHLIFLGFFKLFDGDDFLVLVALAFEDHPVSSLPNRPHNIILLHCTFITINWNH